MKYMSEKEFKCICKSIPYWKFQKKRWKYISSVIDIVKMINPCNVLELGNMGMNITDCRW